MYRMNTTIMSFESSIHTSSNFNLIVVNPINNIRFFFTLHCVCKYVNISCYILYIIKKNMKNILCYVFYEFYIIYRIYTTPSNMQKRK